jgi:6-phosphogluconate dehydrogenase
MATADIGLIGLAVMGQNLAMNMNDKGYIVAVFNRTAAKTEEFMDGPAKGSKIVPTYSVEELVKVLKRPRKIMLMVKAGAPVDEFIDHLSPYLEEGDIIIDGGNSLFTDSTRRTQALKKKGILFVGAGISGGEEGARNGPSIMPGGNSEAWPAIKPIFQAIAAKVDNNEPCCDWVGDEGAGHFVKMVHNGIEYGDMQLISESYQLLRDALHLTPQEISDIFADWNKGELDSYLIEITSHVLKALDSDNKPLIDKILDVAGQKGTGKWTVNAALDVGMPLTLIGEAVFARFLSSLKDERIAASKVLNHARAEYKGDKQTLINAIKEALYLSKIISYAQGFMLMRAQAEELKWNLNYGKVALMWRGGCIIRSVFLGKIKEAYDKNPNLKNLLLDPFFADVLNKKEGSLRKTISESATLAVPTPCMSTALSFYDGYRTASLPANMIQALRDYFGAHTYERIDQPRGKYFHTNWTGTGGKVSSSSYNA